jgi:hypothetical protein
MPPPISSSSYTKYLPPFLASPESDPAQFLSAFLCIFEKILTGLPDGIALQSLRNGQYRTDLSYEEIINRLPDLFNPWRVPIRFLPFLAFCMGLTLDPTWDEYRQRRMIEGASALFQQRWLKSGLYAYLAIASASAPVQPRVCIDDGEAILNGTLNPDGSLALTTVAFARPALLANGFGSALTHPTAMVVTSTGAANAPPYYLVGAQGSMEITPANAQVGALWRISPRGEFLDWQTKAVNNVASVPLALNSNDSSPLKKPVAIVERTPGTYLVLDSGGTIYSYAVTVVPGSPAIAVQTTAVAATTLNAVAPVDMILGSASGQVLVLDAGSPPAISPRILSVTLPIGSGAPTPFNLGSKAVRPTGMVLEPAGTLLITDAGPPTVANQGDVLRMSLTAGASAVSLLQPTGPTTTNLTNPVDLALFHDNTAQTTTVLILDDGLNLTRPATVPLARVMARPARVFRIDPSLAAPVLNEVALAAPLVQPVRILFDPLFTPGSGPVGLPDVFVVENGSYHRTNESTDPTPLLDWRIRPNHFGVTIDFSGPDFAGIAPGNVSKTVGPIFTALINVLNTESPAHVLWSSRDSSVVGG